MVTLPELDAAIRKPTDTDLGPLQIADYADKPPAVFRGRTQSEEPLTLFVLVTVRAVQPGNVEAGIDHIPEDLGIVC